MGGREKERNPRIYEFYGQRPGVTQMGRKEMEKCYFGASHDLEGRSIPSWKLCIIRFSFVGYFRIESMFHSIFSHSDLVQGFG